jgi:hypothetical protein
MASSQRPAPGAVNSAEVLTVLTLKYLDGALAGDELAVLEGILRANASGRDAFVQLCHLHGCLLEMYRARREALQPGPPGPTADPASEPTGEDTVLRDKRPDDTVRVPGQGEPGPEA